MEFNLLACLQVFAFKRNIYYGLSRAVPVTPKCKRSSTGVQKPKHGEFKK
jgi:hypothetical protein